MPRCWRSAVQAWAGTGRRAQAALVHQLGSTAHSPPAAARAPPTLPRDPALPEMTCRNTGAPRHTR
jgi:hypothetical protein